MSSELQKVFDPKGLKGILARGSNVYMGGSPSAPGAGRPRKPNIVFAQQMNPALLAAIERKLASYARN